MWESNMGILLQLEANKIACFYECVELIILQVWKILWKAN